MDDFSALTPRAGDPKSAKQSTFVKEQLTRLAGVWPALRNNAAMLEECERLVLRHKDRLVRSDLEEGISLVIEISPAKGYPPGPNEVIGCVLRVREERMQAERDAERSEELRRDPPARQQVAGKFCTCGKRLVLLPEERVLWCEGCNRVIAQGRGIALSGYEVDQLSLIQGEGDEEGGPFETPADTLARMKADVETRSGDLRGAAGKGVGPSIPRHAKSDVAPF